MLPWNALSTRWAGHTATLVGWAAIAALRLLADTKPPLAAFKDAMNELLFLMNGLVDDEHTADMQDARAFHRSMGEDALTTGHIVTDAYKRKYQVFGE